jgi:hypothetical protein
LIGPFERLGHGAVIVFDKRQHFAFQLVARGEVAAFEHLAHQNAEPDFHLIHPGGVLGGVMENDLVGGVTQEGRPRGFGLQDAGFAFDAQIFGNPGFGSDITYQTLGEMGIEIITDVVPFADGRFGADTALNMREKILFGARRLSGNGGNLPRSDVEIEGEGQRTVADVFELPAFDLARLHGQPGVFPFQGLHAGHLIQTLDAFTLFGQGWRLAIERIDVINFVLKFGIMLRGEPIAVQMRLDLGIFLKVSPRGAERSFRQCLGG